MTDAAEPTGWRGSAEAWLAAAHEALIEGGVDAVRIQLLGKRMNLSRTSFYWFFRDRAALLDALIDEWENKNTGSIVARASAAAGSVVEALFNVSDCWFDDGLFDTRLEFAIRSWAQQSPALSTRVRRADGMRMAALEAMFRRHGTDPSLADVRARTTYMLQIGYMSMQLEESFTTRVLRTAEYLQILTGIAPTEVEVDSFLARHSVSRGGARRRSRRPARV